MTGGVLVLPSNVIPRNDRGDVLRRVGTVLPVKLDACAGEGWQAGVGPRVAMDHEIEWAVGLGAEPDAVFLFPSGSPFVAFGVAQVHEARGPKLGAGLLHKLSGMAGLEPAV